MKQFCGARSRAGRVLAAACAVLMTSTTLTAVADEGIVAGFFRGSEIRVPAVGNVCFDSPGETFVTDVATGITASVSGGYDFSNTGHHYGGETQIAFYTSFDPADPTANRVGWTTLETTFDQGAIQLQAGTEYTMVVQSFDCGGIGDDRGEWSYAYRGPGMLSGPGIHPLPAYGAGTINSNSPTFNSPACGTARYQSAGPIQVPVSGQYRYSDASVHFDLDIEVYIYQGGFNAASPQTNLFTIVDDGATVRMEQGVDYYLVTAPWGCGTATFGDYQYVLLGPSNEFVITEGVNGAWANFETLGQGQLMEVYPDVNLLFSAWFTWDTMQPDPGHMAGVGDPNHRWLTAQGGFEGDTATLDIYVARGGMFDDPAPVQNDAAGTMTIQVLSCNEALVTYDVGEQSGSYTMNKIANDNVATCQMLRNQHKVPVQ